MFRSTTLLLGLLAGFIARPCLAQDALITSAHYANGESVPYILSSQTLPPRYIVILFPGGAGIVDPHLDDGKLVYGMRGNFLVRARKFLIDDELATVVTNTTGSEERIQALLDDITARFPAAQIYLMGTSRGTSSTIKLAAYLEHRIAGEIHTSSMNEIYFFDAKKFSNRQLVVHHRDDQCRVTPFASAQHAHEKYGNEFIVMEGGISTGDACEAFAHHGYNGIEKETMEAIRQWIKQAPLAR
ncbi:MAG: hypothetical protein EPO06_01565 [Burkholderiaceae bacterium]|nr:MAG: hypothetical protein EPO06_01565 [Burkholderiaceae bacterium]